MIITKSVLMEKNDNLATILEKYTQYLSELYDLATYFSPLALMYCCFIDSI